MLEQYTGMLQLDGPVDGPYLFHPPQSACDRAMATSDFSRICIGRAMRVWGARQSCSNRSFSKSRFWASTPGDALRDRPLANIGKMQVPALRDLEVGI